MRNALRALWAEPRPERPPVRVWRDWVLLGVLLAWSVLEALLREDVAWRPVVLPVIVVVLLALLWRRTHPLAAVVAAFGVLTTVDVVRILATNENGLLWSISGVLVLPYSLFRWGAGREAGIGLGVILVWLIVTHVADPTDVGEVVAGYGFFLFSASANEADWATTTVRSTWSIIDRQLKPKLGLVRVRGLTTVMIDEFYEPLRIDGAVEGGPLSPGSVQRIHGVLHRVLAQAMRWEWIWSNPAAAASPPRMEPTEMRPPSPEEVGRLLEHVKAHQPLLHLFLILAAVTGARRGQLLALRWADVDFEHNSLSFQRAWVEGPNGPVLAPTKTRRSHRVALDPCTQALLEDQWDQAAWVSGRGLDDTFIFSNHSEGERPWNPYWVTKQFIRQRKAAGIDHFRLHDLRHFMATQMLGAGVAVPVVSARLAHARASTTLNVYAHAIPGADVQAAQLISGM